MFGTSFDRGLLSVGRCEIVISSIGSYLRRPSKAYLWLRSKGLTNWVSDEAHIRMLYYHEFGTWPDLRHPKRFSEKLQWLKLHDRRAEYTQMVDKYAVKQFVADRIGKEFVVPTYESWLNASDISLDNLPDRFVLKTNHDSGGVLVCNNKSRFDLESAQAFMEKHLKVNYYYGCREWPYKDISPLIFAEQYLDLGDDGDDAASSGMIDYKFYCFNGEPRFLYVSQGLTNHATACMSFLDLNWTFAAFRRSDYEPLEYLPKKPSSYEKMLEIAQCLSSGIPFVRVDLYEFDNQPMFSELTFSPCGGFMQFIPDEWDYKIGELLVLPR